MKSTELRIQLARPGFRLDVEASWDERVAVVFGPSGSGKSSLFETVLGLHPNARAQVRVGGIWLDDPARGYALPVERRALGWVPQDPTLFPHLSVEQNLRFGSARAGARGSGALELAIGVLEIGALLPRNAAELSGGERQRVAIARALASGPQALLLDEPLAALDLPLRARVLPYLLRVRNELDIPILYITHDPDEALIVGEVIVVLDGGRIVACGDPHEVLWSRSVLPLSEALGLENTLEGRVIERRGAESVVETCGGIRLVLPAALAPGVDVRLGVRAEDLLLSAGKPGPISARNVLPATVAVCERREGDALVHLDAGRGEGERLVAKITASAAEMLALGPGVPVHVVIKAQALRRLA